MSYDWCCATMDAAFEPRDGAGLLSFRGRLWILGGAPDRGRPACYLHRPHSCLHVHLGVSLAAMHVPDGTHCRFVYRLESVGSRRCLSTPSRH